MTINGSLLIGGQCVRGSGREFRAVEAETGRPTEPSFAGADELAVDAALALAWDAFATYRETTLQERAVFLERIASEILEIGDDLIVRAMLETGLPRGRLEGERARTVDQLLLFAAEVLDGSFEEQRFDPADPQRRPVPKPDLRLRNIALGPVAVFGASNFPLAFSVAGGDTASALAAGCPVIVKAHAAHPGTSELVGRAVQRAVEACDLPAGTFALLFDAGFEVGSRLVADHRVRAVGFTGSRKGGLALMQIASKRLQPIPVYAEMSSINPVILFPNALAERASSIAEDFVASLTLGAGQFCTNPGLIIAIDGPDLNVFTLAARDALLQTPAQTMLSAGIQEAYRTSVGRLHSHDEVDLIANGTDGGEGKAQSSLFETTASAFMKDPALREEVFGAAGLIIRCIDAAELEQVVQTIEGQLTIALHCAEGDMRAAKRLLPGLELLAGRILVNGFGTGVEVSPAMVHGGPYPATSDGRSTSVGTMAIYRFLRPVSYQNFPGTLLPERLRHL